MTITTGAPAPPTAATRHRTGVRRALAVAGAVTLLAVATGACTETAEGGSATCGDAVLCDGFEDQAGPALQGSWAATARDCSGTGKATVDTGVAHFGGRSLRIDGGVGYCNHVFARPALDLRTLGPSVNVRFWVFHTTPSTLQHTTFLALRDEVSGRDLRMGGQSGRLMWNRESDDATLPPQSPQGVANSAELPTGRWVCVQLSVDAGTPSQIHTALDGAPVPGLTADGAPTADLDAEWYRQSAWHPTLSDLRLGWESYGDGQDTLWFDDVAVGSSPIGC
jgi:hypothetical protein